MEKQKKTKKRYEFRNAFGENMRKALDSQKKKMRDVCYDLIEVSDYEAGEVIAKKYLENL